MGMGFSLNFLIFFLWPFTAAANKLLVWIEADRLQLRCCSQHFRSRALSIEEKENLQISSQRE